MTPSCSSLDGQEEESSLSEDLSFKSASSPEGPQMPKISLTLRKKQVDHNRRVRGATFKQTTPVARGRTSRSATRVTTSRTTSRSTKRATTSTAKSRKVNDNNNNKKHARPRRQWKRKTEEERIVDSKRRQREWETNGSSSSEHEDDVREPPNAPRRGGSNHTLVASPRNEEPPNLSQRVGESGPMEIPYFLHLGLPGENAAIVASTLSEQHKEPLRVGDVIFYFHPAFVAGTSQSLRITQIIATHPNNQEFPLELDNGEYIPADTRVKRIREYSRGRLYNHLGIFRPIEMFIIEKGALTERDRQNLPGLRRQVERIRDIIQNTKGIMNNFGNGANGHNETGTDDSQSSSPIKDGSSLNSSQLRVSPHKKMAELGTSPGRLLADEKSTGSMSPVDDATSSLNSSQLQVSPHRKRMTHNSPGGLLTEEKSSNSSRSPGDASSLNSSQLRVSPLPPRKQLATLAGEIAISQVDPSTLNSSQLHVSPHRDLTGLCGARRGRLLEDVTSECSLSPGGASSVNSWPLQVSPHRKKVLGLGTLPDGSPVDGTSAGLWSRHNAASSLLELSRRNIASLSEPSPDLCTSPEPTSKPRLGKLGLSKHNSVPQPKQQTATSSSKSRAGVPDQAKGSSTRTRPCLDWLSTRHSSSVSPMSIKDHVHVHVQEKPAALRSKQGNADVPSTNLTNSSCDELPHNSRLQKCKAPTYQKQNKRRKRSWVVGQVFSPHQNLPATAGFDEECNPSWSSEEGEDDIAAWLGKKQRAKKQAKCTVGLQCPKIGRPVPSLFRPTALESADDTRHNNSPWTSSLASRRVQENSSVSGADQEHSSIASATSSEHPSTGHMRSLHITRHHRTSSHRLQGPAAGASTFSLEPMIRFASRY